VSTYFLRKAGAFLFLILFLSLVSLLLQGSRKGSAAEVLAGQRASGSDIERLQQKTGSTKDFTGKYIGFVGRLLRLDFGTTISGEPVLPLILSAFFYTFIITTFASFFTLIYGVGMAVLAHRFQHWKVWIDTWNYLLLSLPVFVIALLLLWTFSISLLWFLPGGTAFKGWFILPVLALGLKSGARMFTFADRFMGEELQRPYVQTLRAFGHGRTRILSLFVLKNMLLPLISFWLLDVGSYLAGAAIIEMIYSVPGVGSLLLYALNRYDLSLIIGVLACVSFLFFVITMLQELLDKVYEGYSEKTA